MRRLAGRPGVLALGLAVLALVPAVANPYLVYVANIALLYVVLAVGLNLLLGYAGQFAFANAALFGIGAYATGLAQLRLGWPFWLALPAGAVFTALAGLLVALPALRLSGLYLALATMAFAQFTQWTMLNWEAVTRGAGGFKVAPPSFAWLGLPSATGVYYLTLAVAAGLVAAAWNTVRSRVGRAMIAVRDSEVAAEALGVDLARTKTLAFAMSAFYAGTAGGLYSATLNFVAPEGFDLFQMVVHFSMVVVGGLGSVWGAVLGAGLLVGLQEALRAFKSVQEIAFGLVLMTAIVFLPDGLASLLRRRVPGWEEPLRRVAPGAAAPDDGRVMAARPRVGPAAAPMLVVRDLAISFGGVRALDGVSLEVAAGEIRGIIGPNGAGKTTLLNAICGFERPARGRVIVAGAPVTGLPASGVAARGLTRTFQTTQLFRGMTVLENVMTGRHRHLRAGVLSAALDRRTVRAEEAEAAAAARRALAFVGRTHHDLSHDSQTLFISQRLPSGAVQIIHLEVLDKHTTSYQVKDPLPAGGALEVGRRYWVNVNLDVRRPTNNTLLSRARSIIEFVPQVTAPEKPIHLPYTGPDGVFRFDIPDVGDFEILIDPPVVSGYDYAIGAGDPNFKSVRLPWVGDGKFTVSFLSGGVLVQEEVDAEELFKFPAGGVGAFRVRGIEESAAIDPANATAFVTGLTFAAEGAFTGSMTPVTNVGLPLTALGPAQVWIGLKNSDDVGTRLDLLAEVYKDGGLIGSGRVNGVAGGSSGFNNARVTSIPLTLDNGPVVIPPGTVLGLKLSARITCEGKTHASGTARLWFNDAQARSGFGATIGGVAIAEFLRKDLALGAAPGGGPKLTMDRVLHSKTPCAEGRPFTPFETWSAVLP